MSRTLLRKETKPFVYQRIAAKLRNGIVRHLQPGDQLTPEQEQKGLWKVTVSRESVIPVINSRNPVIDALMKNGITRKELAELFSGKAEMTWGTASGTKDKSAIHIYSWADQSGAASTWAEYLEIPLKDMIGNARQGDTGIIEAVRRDPLGLSFCNAHFAYDTKADKQLQGIRVLPVDFNENGMIDKKEDIYDKVSKLHHAAYLGLYPSHLCRELSLVCTGKPTDPNIVEFIKWILSDGQEVSIQAGYCELRHFDTEESIKNLGSTAK